MVAQAALNLQKIEEAVGLARRAVEAKGTTGANFVLIRCLKAAGLEEEAHKRIDEAKSGKDDELKRLVEERW